MKKREAILGIYIGSETFALSVIFEDKIINTKTIDVFDCFSVEERINKLSLELKRVLDDNDIDIITITKPRTSEGFEYLGVIKQVSFRKGKHVTLVSEDSFRSTYFQGLTHKEYAELHKLKEYCIDRFGNFSNKERKRIVDVEMINELFNEKFSRTDYPVARSIITALSL